MNFLLALLIAPIVNAAIIVDFNCTVYSGTEFSYTPSAVSCNNAYSDAACKLLYPLGGGVTEYPTAGAVVARPLACFTVETATPFLINEDLKSIAAKTCPKTCGYCCKTAEYGCKNADFPRLNCDTITAAQCGSVEWRTIIAQDCPAACGFCNEGGCVDAVVSCSNDASICTKVGMQDFVNQYCQKTCARCPSTTPSSINGGCTRYNADSVSTCQAWAKNGFCTNSFYTIAEKKARCATTCRIC